MIKEAIVKVAKKENLSFTEARDVFEEILKHEAPPAQIAAFLVALAAKGEDESEIAAAAQVLRQKAIKINVRGHFVGIGLDEPVLDTCGTGGSGINKFNISTCVAFIVAASGVKVAKHGNRAMSSQCGSADVLEALGIKIDASVQIMEEAVKTVGIGFLYAPLYHPALKEINEIRRQIGIRTIFNVLGPLANPAGTTHQLLGVYRKDLLLVMAKALKTLLLKRAFVVYSEDLKDEISLGAKTYVSFLNNKKIENLLLSGSSFGLKKIKLRDIQVKNAEESAQMMRDVLSGKSGAPRDIALANSSACLYILGKVKTLKEGAQFAAQLIDKGTALCKLKALKEFVDSRLL